MPRKRGEDRVLGPFAEGKDRWRLIMIEGGRRSSHIAEGWSAALRLLARLRRDLGRHQRTVGWLADEWLRAKVLTGACSPSTSELQRRLLRGLLRDELEDDVTHLTPSRAAALYGNAVTEPCPKYGRPVSAATHRFCLHLARAFGKWLVQKGHLRANPFADVRPVGVVNVGKPQLRIDEARKFVVAALEDHEETGSPTAVAALLCLLLGLRTNEALLRQVRDLDDGGRLLWIPKGKTRNARRRLEVPEVLRPILQAQCEGKGPEDFLFTSDEGRRLHRSSLWLAVGRICERAGVPRVCTHSLRGLHATLALDSGSTSSAVAAALGHGSFSMTRRHYAAPGTVESAQSRRVNDVLGGTESADILRDLDEGTLRELLALIAERKRS